MAAPTPLSVPRRPAWRQEPVRVVGRKVVPALTNETDRALIDERMHSKTHDTKDNNDGNRNR